jgi:hypothetical protein
MPIFHRQAWRWHHNGLGLYVIQRCRETGLDRGKDECCHYTRIHVENLEASCQMMGFSEGLIYQQDNDPKDTAAQTRKFFAENGIELLKWPSQSPDLNRIEHLCEARVAKQGRTKSPGDLVWHLPGALQEHSMPRRMEAVIRSQGGALNRVVLVFFAKI